MKYVNVYEKSSAYGGPEEGGWWFTVLDPVGCEGTFNDENEASEAASLLQHQLEQPESYYMGINDADGCDPDGHGDDNYLTPGGRWGDAELVVLVQSHPPKVYPEERPRYE